MHYTRLVYGQDSRAAGDHLPVNMPSVFLTALPAHCRIPVASRYSFGVDVLVLTPLVVWWQRRS
jgi:hypothetical protein